MRKIVIFLSLILSSSLVFSQLKEKTKLSKKQLDLYKVSYNSQKEKLKLKAPTNYYFDENVNIFKYNELKEVGVDLKKLDIASGRLNYKFSTVMSHKIIIGTIIKKTYTPNEKRYKTTYHVKVSNYLKGNGEDIVQIKTHSGLLPNKKGYSTDSNDYTYFLGEKVMLYLIPTNTFKLKKTPDGKNILTGIKNKDAWWVKKKLIIKSGYVFDGDSNKALKSLNDTKKDINNILNVNAL